MPQIKCDFLFLVQTWVVFTVMDASKAVEICAYALEVDAACLYDQDNAGAKGLRDKTCEFCKWQQNGKIPRPVWLKFEGEEGGAK
jgi:hypothetical protein